MPYPLIRVLLPLCIGIWAGDCYPLQNAHALLWGGLFVLLALLAIAYGLERYRLRHTHSLGYTYSDVAFIPLAFILLGAALSSLHRPEVSDPSPHVDGPSEGSYLFELSSIPKERERTYVCRAKLIAKRTAADSLTQRGGQGTYLLYVSKEGFDPSPWSAGKLLVARTTLRPFTPLPGNATFDYPTYARRRGWSGTAYIAPGAWRLSQPEAATSWGDKVMQGIHSCRQRLVAHFRSSKLEAESLGLITALTLGDKELLPAETKATFARTGVSHLLALSGLHVGILYTLLLLPTLTLRQRFRWIRPTFLLLALAALWWFALLTGLSASVVRSVTMYSLLTIGLLVGTPGISLNKLASAALLLLIVRPYWLFDVGFQLSCTGVASILYLGPPLQSLYTTHTRWKKYLWSFVSISTAAQVGTAPLVACYFGTFSPYFLLANAWSIPLVTLLLYVSMAWIACYGAGTLLALPAHPLPTDLLPALYSSLTRLLSRGLHLIQQLPYSCIDVARPDATECFITYAVLLLLPLRKGRSHTPCTILILLLLWLLAFYHYFIR